MQEPQQITPKILVTTDFSLESERAFYHALSFAVARQARLTLLHTGSESRDAVPWNRFPSVRETLATWGLLPPDAPRAAVSEVLNVDVNKMAMRDDDPRQGITDYLRKRPTDLLVMTTEGRTGFARLFNPSVAETVSHRTRSHTLMLPAHGRGFVDPKNGRAELKRVLCALDMAHDPRVSLAWLAQWLPALGGDDIEVVFLQNRETDEAGALLLPQAPGLHWRHEARPGDLIDAVIETAQDIDPGLVVLSTAGPLGLIGRMRGSHNDRVLRELRLPLLSVPVI